MTTEKLKNYLENMKALERSIENHQRNLSELRSRTFEQYIEQESYRAHKYVCDIHDTGEEALQCQTDT